MGNCIISFPNRGDQATLSGGSFALPKTNLQNRLIKSTARTTNTADGSFTVNAVYPAATEMRLISLVNHNFSTTATFRVRLYSDPAMTVLEYDSGILPVFDVIYSEETETWDSGNFWDLTISEEDREDLTATLIHILPTPFTEVAARIEVFDSTNPDGYLEAGRLFVGSGWIPVQNMSYGASIGFESRSITDEAIGGAEFHDERQNPRVARFGLNFTDEDEGMGIGFELQRRQGTTKDVFYMWDTNDTFHVLRRSFLGRLRSLNAIEHDFFNNYTHQFEIKEQI